MELILQIFDNFILDSNLEEPCGRADWHFIVLLCIFNVYISINNLSII